MRALWVARWEIATPEACRQMVQTSKLYDFNTLFVQVRGRGDAMYNSAFEPRSELLKDQPADFDPLAVVLEEAKKAGIKVHAWINANYTWESNNLPVSPEHIVNKHPDWLMRNDKNEVTMVAGGQHEGAYTCPSGEPFREHLKNIYIDVATKYAVDGVHFDFIRYPSTEYCYCDRCLAQFKAQMDAKLTPEKRVEMSNLPDRNAYTFAFPKAWDDFRRDQICKLVYTVHDGVKKAKPDVTVSAAVFPSFNDAYNNRFQDWKRWLKEGKVDLICPMAYSTSTETFAANIKDTIDASHGIPVCAGIGSWQISADSTVEKIKRGRELGAIGFCLFAYTSAWTGKDAAYPKAVQESAPILK